MSAMARELVERGGVGESATAIWQDLKNERALHLPEKPAGVILPEPADEAEENLLPLVPEEIAPPAPTLSLVSSHPKRGEKPSSLWPTGHAEGEQLLLFA
jgi:hypothetical protein